MQSRMGQGLQGPQACWVGKQRVRVAVYVRVAGHFQEQCRTIVECMGRDAVRKDGVLRIDPREAERRDGLRQLIKATRAAAA